MNVENIFSCNFTDTQSVLSTRVVWPAEKVMERLFFLLKL